MGKYIRIFFLISSLIFISSQSYAQVSSVTFGKNRVQFKKFKWQYYQTKNFNIYFTQNGQELAKFAAQVAEEELPAIETFVEYSLQRRVTIVVYNEYADMQQSNIGLGNDWQSTNGVTKLVNNKMVVYFNGDHSNLRKQIKEGIAQVLTENVLFGEDLGEVVGNQTLLDLPKWFTDGYIAFTAQNWSTQLDDELKSEILSDKYKNFYAFAFENPDLAGHAFWYYVQEKYKKENVTYLLYLCRVYKNVNKAFKQVCKKKFKYVLADFMQYENEKYENDINKRKAYPKGTSVESFNINKRHDYYRINVNPNKRNNSYAYIEYKKGITRLKYYDDDEGKTTVLLKYGVLSYQNQVNPNYPLMAWDPKGTRLAFIYLEKGKPTLIVYDVVTKNRGFLVNLSNEFDQIQDVKYMLDSKTLLLSAVKNGHTDIFTYNIDNQKVTQITNDVYDDLDASFVAFPNKTGILFASNRPSPYAKTADTVLPSKNRYNIFLITNFGSKPELNQITQLSDLKYGDARYPTQYNESHFTFISDENGVANRYAGFFTTKKAGLDTLVLINDDILRNPSVTEVDSALRANKKTDVDSIAVISVSDDSAYTFPLTNYESSVVETRIAGTNRQVSEVTRDGDEKTLYKLKIDENTLHRRNVTVPPTTYMKEIIMADKVVETKIDSALLPTVDTTKKKADIFQSEFEDEKQDSSKAGAGNLFSEEKPVTENVLKTAKLFTYKPVKFYVDNTDVGFDNTLLGPRFQPYTNGSGPIYSNTSSVFNLLTKIGTSELLEDQKVTGAYRLSTNLSDAEAYIGYENYRRRLDWGGNYYRKSEGGYAAIIGNLQYNAKVYTNIYTLNASYPFDVSRSIRFSTALRSDNIVLIPADSISLLVPNQRNNYWLNHLEYVHDNVLNPALNIWNGLRYKVYIDWNTRLNTIKEIGGQNLGKGLFNWGFDARYYYPIYRNFIWAGRVAGDFSWGGQKTVFYLGGTDGWFNPEFNSSNKPDPSQNYAFQGLAVNLRGFNQNIANGNNSVVINSEFRLPVVTTLFNTPVNNAFLRNFQLIQFIDLGNAWTTDFARPQFLSDPLGPVQVRIKAGGIGPFAGGYGFGARSTLLGYFLRFDLAWPMVGFFSGKPVTYFSMGLDF
ncbi:ShlB/FhaC/HecB family protein [Ferruginibacter albus]|uniref:hypothetical protein n=1 Tax=Ferruginibacter albus TaxID=2875540 RepID=UPI001CC4EF88|nr:hypothetical protein [Ferruginibacter albus]UAY51673.1 hypothetical protein K9M53_13890 [Ferruginibacter albus]